MIAAQRPWRHLFIPLVVSLLVLTVPTLAHADGGSPTRVPGPCTGCLVSSPAGTDPRPLLVLLHGDGETPASMLDAWGSAAAARNIVAFAPACPKSEGCGSQSWWKWDGPPSWLLHQIDALAETRPIDRERMWIAGWSGGGTYIGWNTQELERTFAAMVIHGGGVRPKRSACTEPRASIYFLGGDGNPLHGLAEQLHDYYLRCGHDDMTWTVLKGVDHDGERRALASRRETIFDWLETKRRTKGTTVVAPDAGTDAGLDPAAVPSAVIPPPATPPPPAAGPSCRCTVAGAGSKGNQKGRASMATLALGIAVLRHRHRASRFTPLTR